MLTVPEFIRMKMRIRLPFLLARKIKEEAGALQVKRNLGMQVL